MASPAAALSALPGLAADLAGSVLRPGDPDYASIRKPYVGQFAEALPAAVLRCAGAEDVLAALAFAGSHQLPFALRSGGNSFADWSSTSGLLIDLSRLDTIRPDGDRVAVGPGVRVGTLAEQLAAGGRTVPCGWCPGVRVAGAVLGGGYGVLSRRYGLGADHLQAAQVALADGRLVWCDAEREPDLFWALRGAGGGLFGAVTALELATRPVLAGTSFECRWAYRDAAQVLAAWLRLAPAAPDQVNAELALIATDDPDQEPYLAVYGLALGGLGGFLDGFGPAPERLVTRDLSGAQAAWDHPYPGESDDSGVVLREPPPPDAGPGLTLAKSEFFDGSLPPAAIDALLAHFAAGRVRGEFRDLEFIPWGGAIGRVPTAATAFAHRGARFMLKHNVFVDYWAGDELRQAIHRWVTTSWQLTHPYGSGGVYPNYPDPVLPPWAPAYHGANLDRLRAVKARYDPTDLFRPGGG
jgi:hypothetical protein